MIASYLRKNLLAKLRRRFGRHRYADQRIEDRKLGLLAHHQLFQHVASGSVLAMLLLIAPTLESWRGVLAVTVLLGLTLICNRIIVRRLQNQLRDRVFDRKTRRQVIRGIGVAAFLWGCLTWPLDVGSSLDFMSFLIITIMLFSICLSVLSSGFHAKAMTAAAIGVRISRQGDDCRSNRRQPVTGREGRLVNL